MCVASIINKQMGYVVYIHMYLHLYLQLPDPVSRSLRRQPKINAQNKLSKSQAKSTSEYPADILFDILSARSLHSLLRLGWVWALEREITGVSLE